MTNKALNELAEHLVDEMSHSDEPSARLTIARRTLADAYELGTMNRPEREPDIERTPFGQPADPEARAGLVVRAVHSIGGQQLAEHGEDALLAWIRQGLREVAQHGANPMIDASIQLVGMPDGATILAVEAKVGA